MACLRTVVFLALLCAVATALDQDTKHPPQDIDNDHHEHHPVPFEDTETSDLAQGYHNLKDMKILAEIEARKFYRPPIFHPYLYPLLHKPHHPETEEVTETEDSNEEAEIPEEAQPYDPVTDSDNDEIDQTGEQEAETTTDEIVPFNEDKGMDRKSYEVPCDFLTMPRYSCYTCYTYLVCKPEGGKIKSCVERDAPYCDNGICSATPSAECSNNSTTQF